MPIASALPYAVRAAKRVQLVGTRFAYYTTAETAFQIIHNAEIWMRSTRTMNDFTEVQHGAASVAKAVKAAGGQNLVKALNSFDESLFDRVWASYQAWLPAMHYDTFITCVSEHDDSEDLHGRLSMWRAYGGQTGVALIFNQAPFFLDTLALGASAIPAAYMEADDISYEMQLVADDLIRKRASGEQINVQELQDAAFSTLRFTTVCTKHKGFKEEREWRVVANPSLTGAKKLTAARVCIGGIPQNILKLTLRDSPDEGLVGLNLPALLDRVIIGPTSNPEVISRALWGELSDAGVSNPHHMIVHSGIPLRAALR